MLKEILVDKQNSSSWIMKLATKQIEQLYDMKTWSLQLETSPVLHTCTIVIIKTFYYS